MIGCCRRRTRPLAGTPSHPHWQVIRRFPNSSHLYSNSDNTDSRPKLMLRPEEFGAFVVVTEDSLSRVGTGWWCDFASHRQEHHVDFAKQWLTRCRFKHVLFSIGDLSRCFCKIWWWRLHPKISTGKIRVGRVTQNSSFLYHLTQEKKDYWLSFSSSHSSRPRSFSIYYWWLGSEPPTIPNVSLKKFPSEPASSISTFCEAQTHQSPHWNPQICFIKDGK